MLTSKQTNLKPLLESKDGLHLTAYLENQGDLEDLKAQLAASIRQAEEWLADVMTAEARGKFMEPLGSLLNDASILKKMSGNIGIFRNENLFRVLNIPIDIERSCQVATSFHVKPLLRWLQYNKDFLLLGIQEESVQIYWGSLDSFRLMDSYSIANSFPDLNDRIHELTRYSKPRLFFAGEPLMARELVQGLSYKNLVRTPLRNSFNREVLMECCQLIRDRLKEESRDSLDKALREFRFAEEGNRTRKNIFQISKAVVQGKVRKLIVTDEISIFGKIDPKSGGLAIHPFALDHEDDCILDDLAQMVLSQGGEVLVAGLSEIPKGRPILAILDDDEAEEKTVFPQNTFLEERS